jgi:RNA polymerase sigma factor (sigma-70 family)
VDALPFGAMSVKSLDPQQLKTWLLATGQRDAVAFRSLYESTSSKLFAFAQRILGSAELAEVVLQDSFVAIWDNAATYQGHVHQPMTWMATLVRAKAFEHLRRMETPPPFDLQPFADDVMLALQNPGKQAIDDLHLSGDAKSLAHCMTGLDGRQRQALGLAFYHDLSHEEVAAQLAVPLGTIKDWTRRSLDSVRACLARRDPA